MSRRSSAASHPQAGPYRGSDVAQILKAFTEGDIGEGLSYVPECAGYLVRPAFARASRSSASGLYPTVRVLTIPSGSTMNVVGMLRTP